MCVDPLGELCFLLTTIVMQTLVTWRLIHEVTPYSDMHRVPYVICMTVVVAFLLQVGHCLHTHDIKAKYNIIFFMSLKPPSFGPGWDSNPQPSDFWANT